MINTNHLGLLGMQLPGPDYFTITGVDPGTVTMGVADMHVNINTLEVVGVECQTLNAYKPSGGRMFPYWMEDTMSMASIRIRELCYMFAHHLNFMRPLFIATEDAFFNMQHPNAFAPLKETIKSMEIVVHGHNAFRPLYRIETTVAKAAIAPQTPQLKQQFKELSKSKALQTSKDKVKWCAERHTEFSKFFQFVTPDEHSLDALVIAYAQLLRIRNNDFTLYV